MVTHYDIVVVGDELAGALAAAMLGRRGYRVLVLCSPPSETIQVAGQRLPTSPLALAGLEGPTFKRTLAELNLLPLVRRRTAANHPAYQVLFPDHRIDVGEDLGREVARELPDDVAALEAWFAAAQPVNAMLDGVLAQQALLPPESFWDRRDFKRIATQMPPEALTALDLLPAGSAVRALVSLPVSFASHLGDPGVVPHARLGEQQRAGTAALEGGREALRALLLERVRAVSGEVRHDVVRGLMTRRGRVVGVGIGDRSETVGCERLVAALPPGRIAELYPEELPPRLAQARALGPSAYRYRLHLVVPVSGVPDPLGRLAYIVRDPAAPLRDGNALMLQVTEGHGQTATLTVEALASDPSPAALAALRRSIRSTLVEFLPFLERHLVLVWSPHESRPPEGSASEREPGPPPVPPEPLWNLPAPEMGFLGLGYSLGIKNLVLATRQILPGLGLEGELCAGWGAARVIGQTHKRPEVDKSTLLAGT